MSKVMKSPLRLEREHLEGLLKSGNRDRSYNLKGFDGSVTLDELFQIREVIHDKLDSYVSGSSIEGNGTNFNFTFNGKPFLLRVQKDEFHTKMWKKEKIGFWSDEVE